MTKTQQDVLFASIRRKLRESEAHREAQGILDAMLLAQEAETPDQIMLYLRSAMSFSKTLQAKLEVISSHAHLSAMRILEEGESAS